MCSKHLCACCCAVPAGFALGNRHIQQLPASLERLIIETFLFLAHGSDHPLKAEYDKGDLDFRGLTALTELSTVIGGYPVPPSLVRLHDSFQPWEVEHLTHLKSLKHIDGCLKVGAALNLAAFVPGLTHLHLTLDACPDWGAEPGTDPDASMAGQVDALVEAGIAGAVREVCVSRQMRSIAPFGVECVRQLARLPNLARVKLERMGLSAEGVPELSRLSMLTCLEVDHQTDYGWKCEQPYALVHTGARS